MLYQGVFTTPRAQALRGTEHRENSLNQHGRVSILGIFRLRRRPALRNVGSAQDDSCGRRGFLRYVFTVCGVTLQPSQQARHGGIETPGDGLQGNNGDGAFPGFHF
jgi:hypothetical protein